VDPGLYVTFFNEGERFDDELPPVGPLEHVVVRDRLLIADRKDGHHADFFGNSRGIEAEYEFQRATGTEPGGVRRTDLRVVAPQGVYLRFVSFGHAAEHDPVPELGPYAIVVVGKQFVEADGDRLAFTQSCAYPDGLKVYCSAMIELKDGKIARQTMVQAWDE